MVTVYTCLKIYLYKKHCSLLPTMLHSLACFIMGLLNMLQVHGFVCFVVSISLCFLSESESFFSYFRVKIVGPIFLSFLKTI